MSTYVDICGIMRKGLVMNNVAVLDLRMDTAIMPRRKGRAKSEEITNPRPRNGNTYAVGAYLEKLREARNLTREPMVRQIINDMHGNITMSMSTLVQIETGKNKSVSAATVDAIRIAVGGDPYDISDLWKLPIPADDDEAGIEASRLEGEERAIQRQKVLAAGGGAIRVIAEGSTQEVQETLSAVLTNKSLRKVAKILASDPKALKIVQAMLDAQD